MNGERKVAIVGSGFIGLAHALMAREAGYEVTVFEKSGRPLGASVRNFGTIWPIGCVPGLERDQALFGARFWRELATKIGIWHDPRGSLSLAHRESAWQVLQEASASKTGDGYSLLSREEILRQFPSVNPEGLRGGLRGTAELVLHTPTAIPLLIDYLRTLGIVFHFSTPIVRVTEQNALETSYGDCHHFDHLLIAAGEEMRLLFPRELAAADITPCRLQMMRSVPQPAGFDLGAIMVGDLTLGHYPAFRDCPSLPILQQEVRDEFPEETRWGIHVIAAQHHDRSVTIGDSHEYGEDLDPASHTSVDDRILAALARFARLADRRISTRWHGTYLKSTRGVTQVVLHPRENITMVTAMGGLGMTLGWGLAKRTVEDWKGVDT
jgi:D-hydroxyproline dehydrogenase subunit beta